MERKLAAILVADVVGYTRLMGEDETGTLQRLTAVREKVLIPLIARHRGRLVKLMGDGLLVDFASIVDAIECALAWQEAASNHDSDGDKRHLIRFRIGLNLGDVIADGDDIYGDGVNIAARIEALSEPGGICISGDAYRQAKGKIEAGFEDLGEQNLKNVTEPVRIYRISNDSKPDLATAPKSTATGGLDNLSIAVLPFANLSGDPEQDVLADGISEEITTTLSKVPGLLVIARNSTITYKSRAVNVLQVGAEQGVRYVMEGSIRKSGNRVRISIQLIDTEDGHHVWADRYDRNIEDIFQLQDEIALRVTTELQVELTEGEMARLRGTGTANLEAWVDQMRAVANTRIVERESYAAARRNAKRAILLDPNYPAPLCILGFICTVEARWGFSKSRTDSIAEARKHVSRALELDPDNAEAFGVLGFVNFLEGHHEEAIVRFKTALEINPNHADVAIRLAITYCFNGQVDEAIRLAQKAIRLNPKYPGYYAGINGFALRLAGRYDEAIAAFQEYGQKVKGFGHVDLAIVYVIRDQLEAARREAKEVLNHKPDFTISNWSKTQLHTNSDLLKRDVEALRQAGLPQ